MRDDHAPHTSPDTPAAPTPTSPRRLRISLSPSEVVLPDSVITVSSDEPLHPESVGDAITLSGRPVPVQLSTDGRTATLRPEGGLIPGRHLLRVGEPSTNRDDQPFEADEIPFFVVDAGMRLPAGLRVEHLVRLRIDELGVTRLPADRRPSGPFVDCIKAVDRLSGMPVDIAFDHQGQEINRAAVLAEVAARRAARFGRIDEALHARLDRADAFERHPVAIWARLPEGTRWPTKSTDGPMTEPSADEARLDEAVAAVTGALRSVVAGEDAEVAIDPHAPVVYATLTAARIRELARNDQVTGIFVHSIGGIDDLQQQMANARSDTVQQQSGLTGAGVKVAVWDETPWELTNLQVTDVYEPDPDKTSKSYHSLVVHGIISNVEAGKPHGHAPGCALHSANLKQLAALVWAVRDRGCTVVSQSFHPTDGPRVPSLVDADIYKDWLALRWPYPTIVQAAGNYFTGDPDKIDPPASEYVNHKGYNGLTVGSHDDTAKSMEQGTVFRNPASAHGDRELPILCANGTGITAAGKTMSGTSMAAPAVAGCAALLQQQSPTLRSWPEAVRAILLASTGPKPTGGTWWDGVVAYVDAGDGAGTLNVQDGALIVANRRGRDAGPAHQGWDIGTLTTADLDATGMSTFVHHIAAPVNEYGAHVKVALAWDSKVVTTPMPETPVSSTLVVDLDLKVFDSHGTLVAQSNSFDNSYEVAEFTPGPNQAYEIRIRRYSGSEDTWYGIAWYMRPGNKF